MVFFESKHAMFSNKRNHVEVCIFVLKNSLLDAKYYYFVWNFCIEYVLSNIFKFQSSCKGLTVSWRRFLDIETSLLNCRANQLTVFYILGSFVMKELTLSCIILKNGQTWTKGIETDLKVTLHEKICTSHYWQKDLPWYIGIIHL